MEAVNKTAAWLPAGTTTPDRRGCIFAALKSGSKIPEARSRLSLLAISRDCFLRLPAGLQVGDQPRAQSFRGKPMHSVSESRRARCTTYASFSP